MRRWRPDDPTILSDLARHYALTAGRYAGKVVHYGSAAGDRAFAQLAYEDAIARYPKHERTPWAWYQIGLIHRRNGNDVQALETFNQLVEMAKERPGELWEGLAKDNQRDLVNVLQYREYLSQ